MKMISPLSGSAEPAVLADDPEPLLLPQAAAMPPSDARPASCMLRLSITRRVSRGFNVGWRSCSGSMRPSLPGAYVSPEVAASPTRRAAVSTSPGGRLQPSRPRPVTAVSLSERSQNVVAAVVEHVVSLAPALVPGLVQTAAGGDRDRPAVARRRPRQQPAVGAGDHARAHPLDAALGAAAIGHRHEHAVGV